MMRLLAFSVGAAVAMATTTNREPDIVVSFVHDPLEELTQEVKTLREDNKQLRALVQMQSLTPLTTPSHLRARDMGDDTWWLTTDTNHWFVMIGTNGSKIVLQHK